MKLAEALKASKDRIANAIKEIKIGSITFNVPIAVANDAGVEFFDYSETAKEPIVEKSWAELLPNEVIYIESLDWQPVSPKDPLIQLAESLSDWSENDRS